MFTLHTRAVVEAREIVCKRLTSSSTNQIYELDLCFSLYGLELAREYSIHSLCFFTSLFFVFLLLTLFHRKHF